jgi:hypothetical protein
LSQATPQELVAIEGIGEVDVKRIKEYSTRAPPPTMHACATCGAAVKVLKGHCWRCAESLEGVSVPAEELVACPNCKSPVKKGLELCPTCSVPIRGALKQNTPEPPPPPPPRPPVEARRLPPLKFKSGLVGGKKGMCVTRVFPQKVREQYELSGLPIIWLSNIGKEDSVRPKDLEKLSLLLEQFLTKESGLVLLDGIEYLITNNNFLTVLRLVQSLRDQIAVNKATLLLSVNPSTLDSHQLNLLEREVDGVIDLTAPVG